MPSKSKSQARMMAAAAHNPDFAKKVGVSRKVAKEFNQADKGRSWADKPERTASSTMKHQKGHGLYK